MLEEELDIGEDLPSTTGSLAISLQSGQCMSQKASTVYIVYLHVYALL